MKATEQRFPVMLLIMLYKVVLTGESVDGFLNPFTPRGETFEVVLTLVCRWMKSCCVSI